MTHRFWRRCAAPATLSLGLLLGACSADDPTEMLASARQYLDKNDHPAAIIQLKNALQAQPDLAEARFLLGRALLLKGDPAGAETELQKARELGHSPDQVTPLLVRSRLALGQFRQVTEDFAQVRLGTPQAQAELHTQLAIAWRQLGNAPAFEASLQAALAAQSEHAGALVEQARSQAARQDFGGAVRVLDGVLTRTPVHSEALKLRGDIRFTAQGQAEAALADYRAAAAAALPGTPEAMGAQAGAARVLLATRQLEPAAREIEALGSSAPGHPQTLYLQAQLAFEQGRFADTRTRLQELLKRTPDSPMALELAGATEYQLGAWSQAELYAQRALQNEPQLRVARQVLLMTHLRTGDVDKALAMLPADLATNNSDPGLLALAGEAYMLKGDTAQAQQYFSRAARLDPTDASKRTSLAVSTIASGRADEGMALLRDIASTDTGVMADMALINAHIHAREWDQALAAIDALSRKRASDPMPAQMRGRVLLMRGDRSGARTAFERAQQLDTRYFPATAALVSLDLAERKPAEARTRLQALLKDQPRHPQALMALAEVEASSGAAPATVADLIREAIKAAPNDKAPHLMLVEHHLRHQDTRAALVAAQSAASILPEVPEVIDALGRAQSAAGDHQQAKSTFGKLGVMLPRSPLPHLRMATVLSATGDTAGAQQSLRSALALQPDLLPAQRALVDMALKAGRSTEALGIARQVQTQRPKEAVGFMMEGDVQALSKNWDAAASAYRTGARLAPSTELSIKLHTVLIASGKGPEADKLAADWQKAHPQDGAFVLYLGDRALASQQWAVAQRHYERVVELNPTDALALNNLAWVAGRQGRADAVSLAERATKAAPGQPAYLDTLAVLLSERNEHARAISVQKQAVALDPASPVYKLHLARIHIQAGDKAAAKPLLDELAALGDRFGRQAEVKQLREGL